MFFVIPIAFVIFIYIKASYIEAPYFISTGKILPQGQEGIGSKLSGLMSTFGVPVQNTSTNINDSQLFPDIIKSRDFNISLLNRTFYYESKTSGQPLIKILTGRIPSTPNDSLRLITRGLRRLKRMVRVIPNKVNSVITISVTAGHPRLASELANAVIDELDEFQRRFKTEKIKEKRIFIEGRMVEVKNQLVKVPRKLQELYSKIKNELREFQKQAKVPTIHQLAERLNITEEETLEAMEAGQNIKVISLDAPTYSNEFFKNNSSEVSLLDNIGTSTKEDQLLNKETLKQAIKKLPGRERRIIYLRFYGNLSQTEIAIRIRLSQMHVSRILSKSIKNLRKQIKII